MLYLTIITESAIMIQIRRWLQRRHAPDSLSPCVLKPRGSMKCPRRHHAEFRRSSRWNVASCSTRVSCHRQPQQGVKKQKCYSVDNLHSAMEDYFLRCSASVTTDTNDQQRCHHVCVQTDLVTRLRQCWRESSCTLSACTCVCGTPVAVSLEVDDRR